MSRAHDVLSHCCVALLLLAQAQISGVSFHVVRHAYQTEQVNQLKDLLGKVACMVRVGRPVPDTPLPAVKSRITCWELLLLALYVMVMANSK